MRKYFGISLIAVALLSVVVWALSQFVRPLLPSAIRSHWVLLAGVVVAVVALLSQLKNVVDLFHSVFGPSTEGRSSPSPGTLITGPIHVVHGNVTNVTLNVTYVVQTPSEGRVFNEQRVEGMEAPKSPIAPWQAPPLPSSFTGRTAEITAIKQVLFRSAGTVALTSIVGLGGIGKTVLAAAVARDDEVQKAFPDGTLWACMRDQSFRETLIAWIHALEPTAKLEKIQESDALLLKTFKKYVSDRRMLIVLDDVDEKSVPYVDLLKAHVGAKCRTLITSRLVKSGADTVLSLDVLPESEALRLFEQQLSRRLTAQEKETAGAISFLCGHLPLSLMLAARLLKSGISFETLRKRLENTVRVTESTHVDEIRSRPASVEASLNWVYERLRLVEQERFRSLSVFAPPHNVFNIEAAAAIWQVPAHAAEETLRRFTELALLFSQEDSYNMHPLVRSFAERLLCEADSTEQQNVNNAYERFLRDTEADG